MMVRTSLRRGVIRATLVTLAAVAAGWFVYSQHMGSMLLRSDPALVAGNPALFSYAVNRGRAHYRLNCLRCHAEGGSGDPARGTPALSDADWLYGTGLVSDIERTVTYGIRSNHPKAWNLAVMPAFGRPHPSPSNASIAPLSPAEVAQVIEFLMQARGRSADAAAAAAGARIYQGVGACFDCHSPDARGDSAIGAPNLVDDVTLYGDGGRDALYESIANGRQGVCPSWIGVLTPLAIREVAVYVYGLSHSATLR